MRAASLVLLVALAGCVADPPASTEGPAAGATFGASASDAARAATTELFPIDHAAVEPSIAITEDGTLIVVARADTMRSTDGGASWEVVASNPGGFTFDPWVSRDPVTDRVFSDHLTIACTNIAWSDDAGASWTPFSPAACGAPVTDFQKLAHGVPGPGTNPLAGVAYPSVTYICYNKVVSGFGVAPVPVGRYGTACAASYDGGASFQNERVLSGYVQGPVGPLAEGCAGGAWGPAVGPDGTVVVRSQPNCMFRSRDSGLTWDAIGEGPPFDGTQFAFDANGTLYAISLQYSAPLQMSRSTDQGETWSEPWTLAPPGVGSTFFSALVAGDAGRVAVAFVGTNDTFEDTLDAPEDTRWHAWIVAIENADSEPAMVAHRATPDEAPMIVGCISRAQPCPFTGDFITMAMHPDGTPYAVFPDTCNEGCEGNPDATLDDAMDVKASVVSLRGWSLKAS